MTKGTPPSPSDLTLLTALMRQEDGIDGPQSPSSQGISSCTRVTLTDIIQDVLAIVDEEGADGDFDENKEPVEQSIAVAKSVRQ